jgi:hypothetical protein
MIQFGEYEVVPKDGGFGFTIRDLDKHVLHSSEQLVLAALQRTRELLFVHPNRIKIQYLLERLERRYGMFEMVQFEYYGHKCAVVQHDWCSYKLVHLSDWSEMLYDDELNEAALKASVGTRFEEAIAKTIRISRKHVSRDSD